jgi:hypothetical protein
MSAAVEQLVAGKELDYLIAEKIFGERRPQPTDPNPDWQAPAFSNDYREAWMLAEKLDLFASKRSLDLDVGFVLRKDADGMWVVAYRYGVAVARAETVPLVICRAALATREKA